MGVPSQINDGNWSARAYESIEYRFPFSEKGDNTSFRAICKCRMDKNAYRPLAPMSAQSLSLGTGFLVKAGEPRDIGCGLYEFQDEFCNVPITRYEYGTFTQTLQVYAAIADTGVDPAKYFYSVTFDLEEQTFTVPATFKYEYFQNTPPVPLLKSRLFMLFGRLYQINGTPANGQQIVIEDSQIDIYGGMIYERRTPYGTVKYGNV